MRKSLYLCTIASISFAFPAYAQNQDPHLDKLPPGPERAILAEACTVCHTLERVATAQHDEREWGILVDGMVNVGAPLTPAQIPQIKAYLSKIVPTDMPPLKIIAGPAKVTIKEWDLPTAGTRPHDPLSMPDGTMWYTGHRASLLGHLDPKTGKITEYKTKTPVAGPHGLTADADGNVWYTGNFKSHIGKLDVKTGQFTEYRMPDPKARDPHTPMFDKTGMLWFTVQGANMIGRLNPKTSEIKLVEAPTPRSLPYGTVFDTKGVLWIDLFGTNKLASIDKDMKVTEYTLPDAKARPRRIAIDSNDTVWYSDFDRGYLGKFDTKTGKLVKEYMSPSGPRSEPYGITVINDIVWYAEGNSKPNGLVRFDPKTETFQTFVIPNGGVVRNMMPTKDGKGIVMAESAANKVAIAYIE
jgi:virginiamycin B lyase